MILAPPRPPAPPGDRVDRSELEALIEEARRRARRRCRIYGAVAALAALAGVAVFTVLERAAPPSRSASAALGTPVNLSAATASSKIAFLRDPDGDGLFGGDIELWVMSPDGSGQRRLTRKAADSFAPAWSPDARRIAFVRHRRGARLPRGGRAENQDIYVINADGSGERRLTSGPVQSIFPAWSLDGRKIAFTRASARRTPGVRKWHTDIYVMNADGSGERRLTRDPLQNLFPAWSPDGRKIAFTGISPGTRDERTTEIYVIDADGSWQRKLTHTPGGKWFPVWSPDGRKIAFTSLRDGQVRWRPEVYVMNADGTGQRKLAPGSSPAWSPDGRKIAFVRDGVRIMNADGTGQRKVAAGGSPDSPPVWSPDSRQLLVTRYSGEPVPKAVLEHGGDAPGNFEIFVVNVDGRGTRRLTRNPGDDVGAAWSAQQKK